MKVDLTDKFTDEEFLNWFMTDTDAYDTDHNTKLCYAECLDDDDEERQGVSVKLWFTVADMGDQWGDDWDDSPYEVESGEPYDSYIDENGTRNCSEQCEVRRGYASVVLHIRARKRSS